MHFKISYKGESRDIETDGTLMELMKMIDEECDIPVEVQKLIAPKVGLVRLEKQGGDKRLDEIFADNSRITIMGTTRTELNSLRKAEQESSRVRQQYERRRRNQLSKSAAPVRTGIKPSKYGFQHLRALPNLPDYDRAVEYLERIRHDTAVRKIMEKYQFRVYILTELDPKENTTHDGRVLGLNVNKGHFIKLRIRTDKYDGFCEYKQVIKTLCHELAHNRHSEHDRQFWDLTNQLEKEYVKLDPFSGTGHRLTNQEFYDPDQVKNELGTGHAEALEVDGGGEKGNSLGVVDDAEDPVVDRSLSQRIHWAAEQRERENREEHK